MAVVFPATPAPNQVVTDPVTNATWRWDAPSQRWVPAATGATFLPIGGGTLTGPLILDGDASNPLGAVTLKQLQGSTGNPEGGGRFQYVNATTVQFIPFNGNGIKINGVFYVISAAGISAAINNAMVNGVAGQTLTDNQINYAYVFNNAGTPALDFSLTGHTTSVAPGNEGVEIKIGDESRTLVGMVYPAAGAFYDNPGARLVRSWLNRPMAVLNFAVTTTNTINSNVTWQVTGGSTQVLGFVGDTVSLGMNWSFTVSPDGSTLFTQWQRSGAQWGNILPMTDWGGYGFVANANLEAYTADGYNLYNVSGRVNAASVTATGTLAAQGFVV